MISRLGTLVSRTGERVVRRHGEAVEGGAVPRRDELQGLVVGMPVAADPVALPVAAHREALLQQGLEGGQAGSAGANDALVPISHRVLPAHGAFAVERWRAISGRDRRG